MSVESPLYAADLQREADAAVARIHSHGAALEVEVAAPVEHESRRVRAIATRPVPDGALVLAATGFGLNYVSALLDALDQLDQLCACEYRIVPA